MSHTNKWPTGFHILRHHWFNTIVLHGTKLLIVIQCVEMLNTTWWWYWYDSTISFLSWKSTNASFFFSFFFFWKYKNSQHNSNTSNTVRLTRSKNIMWFLAQSFCHDCDALLCSIFHQCSRNVPESKYIITQYTNNAMETKTHSTKISPLIFTKEVNSMITMSVPLMPHVQRQTKAHDYWGIVNDSHNFTRGAKYAFFSNMTINYQKHCRNSHGLFWP